MSTEHNVNRVQSNFNIEAEKAKLDSGAPELAVDSFQYGTPNPPENRKKGFNVSEPDSPVAEPEDKLLEQDPEALKSAWKQLTTAAPLIDQVLDTPVIQEQMGQQGLQPNEEVLAQFRQLVGGEDLKVFRAQVIRALKHLGVDTKKFFGE